jgi:hypothetical protein
MPSVTDRFKVWRTRLSSRRGPRVTESAQRAHLAISSNGVAAFDVACASYGSVQTELSAKAANDITENSRVLLRGLRIVSRHYAPATEISETDLPFGQPQNRARPRPLSHTWATTRRSMLGRGL